MSDLLRGKVLAHYSASATLEPQSREQKAKADRKPKGLWVSVEGAGAYGWKEWGTDNNYGCFDHRFSVELASDHNVLLTNDLYGFHEKYARPQYPDEPVMRYEMIAWEDVAHDYQGIVIPTYQWHHRFDTRMSDWYYGWDCASGCIWDAAAIACVTYDSEYVPAVDAPDMSEQEIPF